jgi:hypothetical protein
MVQTMFLAVYVDVKLRKDSHVGQQDNLGHHSHTQ